MAGEAKKKIISPDTILTMIRSVLHFAPGRVGCPLHMTGEFPKKEPFSHGKRDLQHLEPPP